MLTSPSCPWISADQELPPLGERVLVTTLMTNGKFSQPVIASRFYCHSIGRDGLAVGEKWAGDNVHPTHWAKLFAVPERKSSADWSAQLGILVVNPDGWDRTNFDASWAELLTEREFLARAKRSTCLKCSPRTVEENETIKQQAASTRSMHRSPATASNCPECGKPWIDHEFGVPAPYCP